MAFPMGGDFRLLNRLLSEAQHTQDAIAAVEEAIEKGGTVPRSTQILANKYSARNLERMAEGKAARVKLEIEAPNDAGVMEIKTINHSLELHHYTIPQRGGGVTAMGTAGVKNNPWNLVIANRWGHATMDKFAHVRRGSRILRVLEGTNKYSGH